VKPTEQLSLLRNEFPGLLVNKTSVYNSNAKSKSEEMANRTSLQALMDKSMDKGYFTRSQFSESKHKGFI
jgi:hypothetical protein